MQRRKKAYGQAQKPRTEEEISKDYNQNAIMASHKAVQIKEREEEIEKLQEEIAEHFREMSRCRKEARHIPPKPAEKPKETEVAIEDTKEGNKGQSSGEAVAAPDNP